MGGFYFCRDDEGADARLAKARAQFVRHGFGAPVEIATPNYRGFHVPYIHGGPATFHRDGDDFVAVAGTLTYRDRTGTEALAALLADFTVPFTDWDRIGGQFALVVRKGGRTLALTDFFGAFQLFRTADFDIVSTSLLATVAGLDRVSLDAQGVYEFAFNVFPTGDDTVLQEVRRLGPHEQVELGPEPRYHRVPKPLPETLSDAPLDALVADGAARLRAVVAPFARGWGDAMQCPLSGGLDSRLALALLRDAGVRPHVYVYGPPGDEDVEIARAIASAEGFPLEHFDKSRFRSVSPDDYPAIVERNFHETDALVTDGGMFDNGGNAAARHARHAGGALAVSGGCGEVFRNFFYLPDRPLRARDIVAAFYARYTRLDLTDAFDEERFLRRLEAKALEALDMSPDERGPLPRPLIEQLYPRMRCRAFFGREISLVGRHGGYLMPFLATSSVALGLRLPMAVKDAGRFEARLLAAIDPSLARHASAYGHSFDRPPSLGHRFGEWTTRIRPVPLRRRSYDVQRRLGLAGEKPGGLMGPDYLGRVLDIDFPFMRRFFRVDAIADTGLYRRVATLEYLAQHIGTKIIA